MHEGVGLVSHQALSVSAAHQSFIHSTFPIHFDSHFFFLSFRFPLDCPSNAFSLTIILPLISFHVFSFSFTLDLLPLCLPTSFSPSPSLDHNLSVSSLSLGPPGSRSLCVIPSLSITSHKESPWFTAVGPLYFWFHVQVEGTNDFTFSLGSAFDGRVKELVPLSCQ